jgi:hypothetical protein
MAGRKRLAENRYPPRRAGKAVKAMTIPAAQPFLRERANIGLSSESAPLAMRRVTPLLAALLLAPLAVADGSLFELERDVGPFESATFWFDIPGGLSLVRAVAVETVPDGMAAGAFIVNTELEAWGSLSGCSEHPYAGTGGAVCTMTIQLSQPVAEPSRGAFRYEARGFAHLDVSITGS